MKKDCPFDNLNWKIGERQVMWDIIDQLKAMHEVTLDAQQSRDVALADGPDGDAKAGAYLRTKPGKKKLRFDTTVCYSQTIHKNWKAGNAVQKMFAPTFKSEIEGQATLMAVAVQFLACGNKRALDQAYTDAKSLTVVSYHKLEKDRQLEHYYDLRKSSVTDFKMLLEEVVETLGTRNSKWEKLHDEGTNTYYHYNWKTRKQEDSENPAICEMCDSTIDPHDFKCFECNTLRSSVNQPKYVPKIGGKERTAATIGGREKRQASVTGGAIVCVARRR